MTALTSKLGKTLSVVYTAIFGLLLSVGLVEPIGSEFMGVYYIFLTLPWSIILVTIVLGFDSAGHPGAVPFSITLISLIMFAMINALSIYRVGAAIERARTGAKERTNSH